MASYRPARPVSVPEWRPRTHVSFRITLPPSTYASTVDVVGSWDDYAAAVPLEQDRRVGRDVWKTILTHNGGLEMGSEHYYYFLLDRKHPMPDPQSPPSSLTVHPRTGRLISVLFVPVELPPTPEPTVRFRQPVERLEAPTPSPSIAGSSVFADFDGEGDEVVLRPPEQTRTQPHPQQPRQTEYHDGRKGTTFRERLRARRSFLALSGPEDEHKPKRRRGWGLQLSVSTAFLRKSYKSAAPDGTDSAEDPYSLPPQRDERETADIVEYLRNDNDAATPKVSCCIRPALATKAHSTASSVYSQNPDQASLSPGMYSSFYSSEDDEDELATPVDVAFPRHCNFGGLKGGATAVEGSERSSGGRSSVPSLECLREQMAWRNEMVGEHGYLGSVVV